MGEKMSKKEIIIGQYTRCPKCKGLFVCENGKKIICRDCKSTFTEKDLFFEQEIEVKESNPESYGIITIHADIKQAIEADVDFAKLFRKGIVITSTPTINERETK